MRLSPRAEPTIRLVFVTENQSDRPCDQGLQTSRSNSYPGIPSRRSNQRTTA